MPDDEALRDLAQIYLDLQSRFWQQYCPSLSNESKRQDQIERMIQSFKTSFLDQDAWDWEANLQNYSHVPRLGKAYVRYSCDNSNPRSLAQQLRNILERAQQDKVFIPWEFVLADAAVTGTIAARRGYQMIKTLIAGAGKELTHFYIDELGRASRDHVEALILGKLVSSEHKRMIGVTDGFDSDNPQSKVMLTIFAMLHELFIDQLREKVHRGMRDAFEQGKNVRPAAIGYRLIPMVGKDRQSVIGSKGVPLQTREIDPEWAPWIVKCFELYVEKLWSRKRIAHLLNRERVGGKASWDSGRIRQLLRCETYAGFEHQNKVYRKIDPATGGGVTHTRPTAEWQRREVPHLAIVSQELFDRAQQRLEEQHHAFKANGSRTGQRAGLSPTLLVRPVCGYCGNLLWLGNSGQHPSLCCINGRDQKSGCQLTSYKSVRIINQSILGFVLEQLESIRKCRCQGDIECSLHHSQTTCCALPDFPDSFLEQPALEFRIEFFLHWCLTIDCKSDRNYGVRVDSPSQSAIICQTAGTKK
ncbi:MAG TPA: recombinase family protein [Planctomicrobium sp.]|nr:recombinase family protein [Planctomicrobium sp.]